MMRRTAEKTLDRNEDHGQFGRVQDEMRIVVLEWRIACAVVVAAVVGAEII